MKRYDMRDYENLKGSAVVQSLAGQRARDGSRLDGVSGASAFFARELDYVKAKAYDKQYPELSALAYLPQTSEVNEGAETATWYGYEVTGLADIINNYAEDLPRADVMGKPTTVQIKSIGDSYGYNAQEMRASIYTGKGLDARKATAARRAHDTKVNQIAFVGDKKSGLIGIFSDDAGIPEYALSEVTVDEEQKTEFQYKTADQILADLTCQNHLHNLRRFPVGDTQTVFELALFADLFQHFGNFRTAAVDENHIHPNLPQKADILHDRILERFVHHGAAAVFNHNGFFVVFLNQRQGVYQHFRPKRIRHFHTQGLPYL